MAVFFILLINGIDDFVGAFEYASRFAEYHRLRKRGVGAREASYQAREIATDLIAELQKSTFESPIVTELLSEMPFYRAEEEHHNYYNDNSEQGYCSYIISPKIQKLKQNYLHLLKTI